MLQLTSSEAQTAEIRVAQARTDAVRRELQQNASNSEKRAVAIARDLRRLGGVPDVVTPAVGRFVAFAKSGADQAQPLPEALFGDLALEHQLLDRARYVKVLAKELDEKRTVQLAERLEKAHSATVEWLTTVLAEEALGGPAALRATPLQTVAGGAYRAAVLPGRFALSQFNRAADRVSQSADVVRSRVLGLKGKAEELGDKATQFTESAADVVSAGVNAGLRTSEGKARANSQTAGENIHEARRKAGALDADELPIKGYGDMGASAAAEAIKELSKAEDIRTVVRHEEAHKNRSSVVSAAQTTLARLAKDAVSN